ncbi:wax ester/triacylglycerol synthase family O-acyltransferase [Mycobacterium sp. 663a-19]|uniref:wax ester/triacylglycerol synthase family O-acyltransferase n=1 Tax=Mycobacterium sp. 663a-19 TaxID=2986148 RepID=UPI002D1F7AD5|nr:wax ester/triacylglycerol synthase family O-acyltransferase [Mycobacterium sp. 663a-19]MEB3981561.1 wax ester/triacylglycerol synthase family O-acyltransferase [Mycobacterium sp. 663a-19]
MIPMDPLDAAMMTAELVASPMHVGAVLILSPPADAGPDFVDNLHRAALAGNDSIDPRLRRYAHRGMDTGGMWVWRDMDTVDVGRHCQRRTVSGNDEFWRLIGELDATRLDRSRPMWMSYLIDGLDDGRFAFYIKVHHTVVDGVAGFQMIADALSTDPTHRSMPPFYADRREGSTPARTSTGFVPRLLAPIRALADATMSGVGLVERVIAGELSTMVDSLVGHTTVLPFGAPFTRFNRRLGPERAVCAGSWAKDRIRAVQDAAGVTGNDVVNGVIADVVRRWLRDRGELPRRSLVAACPITVRDRTRATANDQHGNRFGLWLCPLGTNLDDPVARLDLIHRSMAEGKQWVAGRGSAASLLTAAGSIAATVIFPMLPFTPKIRTGYNLPISHVPGPQREMYWNGAHIDEMYPVSAVYDGQTLNVTTCSYADRIGFGYVAGREAVPDIESLIPLTEQCLSELEAALGVTSVGDTA